MTIVKGGKMIIKIITIFGFLVAGLAVFVCVKTPRILKVFRVETIHSAPKTVFNYINNTELIQKWNPFIMGDPEVKVSFEGPQEGVGAAWSWSGPKAGAGKATIEKTELNKSVSVRLDFERPFKATNYGEYTLAEKGNDTEVTWLVNETSLIPRVISTFINLDKAIGSQFEVGLLELKKIVEKASP
jgi:hypothetical protein